MSSPSSSRDLSEDDPDSRYRSPSLDAEVDDSTSGVPTPPRPTRTEYADYAAIVRAIDKGEHLIAKRILDAREEDRTEDAASPVETIKKGKKKTAPKRSSTAWPLQPAELGDQGDTGQGDHWLEDSIMAFASAYIRQHRLVPPLHDATEAQGPTNGLEGLDEVVPQFLPDIMDTVESLLDTLATMRHAATRTKRDLFKPMGWEQVMTAGVLSEVAPDVLDKTNTTMRSILELEGEDRISHRIALMRESSAPQPRVSLKELLPNIKGKQQPRKRHRPKQNQNEARKKREFRATQHEGDTVTGAAAETKTKSNRGAKRQRTDRTPDTT